MRVDLEIDEFVAVMKSLGISCKVTERIPTSAAAAPGPVQVPQDHTIKKEVIEFTPERKAAATPSPAPKNPAKNKKAGGKIMKCPYCERTMDTRAMQSHAQDAHKDQYDQGAVRRYIKGENAIAIQGIDQDLLHAVPEVRPRTRGDPKGPAPGPAPGPAAEIVSGMHVKQIKPDNGFLAQGIGTVRQRIGKNCEVSYGGKQGYRTISLDCLEVV